LWLLVVGRAAHRVTVHVRGGTTPRPAYSQSPLVESGIETDQSNYADHHLLIVDADTCHLWETYHTYPNTQGGWDILGASLFDMSSNELRPEGWSSSDAAGFPISAAPDTSRRGDTGVISHALRFTIPTNQIRNSYIWPARHRTPTERCHSRFTMGQLFSLKASYQIPSSYTTQAKAILTA